MKTITKISQRKAKAVIAAVFLTAYCQLPTANCFSQVSSNMTLLSNWKDTTVNLNYNDVWGYVDSTGNEYAIFGNEDYTYFVDVTDPYNPVLCDKEPGKNTGGIHRDYKTYKNYCYGVTDEGTGSLQIFDLQYLPDSVDKVFDSNIFFSNAHTNFIDTASGRLYILGDFSWSMKVLDIATNPENPTLLATVNLSGMYVHDAYVRNDTAYCSNGNDGFFIYDLTNPVSPQLISSITTYPEQGYNHSSWVTEDGNTLIFADETQGSGLKIYDISDISNPVLKSVFRSNTGAMAHNPFIKGDSVYIAYYEDGVQVFDITNDTLATQVSYYDTYPDNIGYGGYNGCWGVYPFLPSGNILGCDITYGLFVMRQGPHTQPPAASFSVANIKGCSPYEVTFKNSSINADSVFWDFGDPASPNNTSTNYMPTHIFTNPGIYTVTLNAYNNIGSNTISDFIALTDVTGIVSVPYFEDFEDTSASLCIISDINSHAEIKSSEGKSGSIGLFFAGSSGNFSGWDTTFGCESTFTINADYSSSAILTVNTTGYDTLYLEFDIRQWFQWDPSLTNFHVLVNGVQLDTCFNPSSINFENIWKHNIFDLTSYIDTSTNIMKITFEGANLLYNFFGFTHKTQIDNIRISNCTSENCAFITSAMDVSCKGTCNGQATAIGSANQIPPFTYLWDDDSVQTTATATGLCAGTYSVAVIDSTGDTSTTTVIIGEPAALSVITSSSDATCPACNDGTAIASVLGGSGVYTYQWNDDSTQTTPLATGLGSGTYIITVADILCSESVTDTVIIGIVSNINEFIDFGSIKIYPNPSSGYFNIIFANEQTGAKDIFVYDIFGKLVKNVRLSPNEHHVTIDMFDQSNGMYFIKVTDGDSTVIRKIIIRY
ncbi:MAG: choice-of-anchor B family protein [Cytophagales bacterium]|nr:choice-of-anchor B family protein [Cytophagales bacterium]